MAPKGTALYGTYTTRMTQKGQVTIPAELRSALGLVPRELVELCLVDGEVRIKKHESKLLAGFASVQPAGVNLDNWARIQEETHEYIADQAAKRAGLKP